MRRHGRRSLANPWDRHRRLHLVRHVLSISYEIQRLAQLPCADYYHDALCRYGARCAPCLALGEQHLAKHLAGGPRRPTNAQ